jgi:ABC-type amino acid transport substrate-binding protein
LRYLAVLAAALLVMSACGSADGSEAEADDALAETPDDAAAAEDADTAALVEEFETIEPGVIKVAIQPYHPYTSYEGSELLGLDSEILLAVADKWGMEVETEVTDFAGMLAGVQSGRVDISIGGIAWTKERQEQGLFTDPVYYSPPAMAVAGDEQYSTISDLEGLDLGTVEGYVWVEAIQEIPGATLHAYPDATGVIDDLGAGRIDVGFLDLFLLTAAETERPELGITTQYLTPPTNDDLEEHPDYQWFAPYTVNFYIAPDAPRFEEAFSEEIRTMYESGEMTALIEKYGGDPQQILVPYEGAAEARRGIDRPENWETPSI